MWQTKTSIFTSSVLFSALFLLVGICWPAQTHAQYYNWSINSFDSIIEIQEDASIMVKETIDVTFDIDKHGIYRDLPVRYVDDYGNSFKTDVDVLGVYQDGEPAMVSLTHGYSFLNIRIGDADQYIAGHHVYEIIYSVDRVFLYFDDYDELYWNVTGTDWEVPIDETTVTIMLPDGGKVEQSACYTGYYGSTAQHCTKEIDGQGVTFHANDFLTVAVGFTKGLIYMPTIWDRFVWLITDNWFSLIPFFIMLFTIWFWYKRGKDPKMDKTIIAEYEPPQDIKAVYAGMLAHGRIKKDHLTAMIIQMAVDGYLQINIDSKTDNGDGFGDPKITLKPLKPKDGLDDAHARFHDIIFKGKMDKGRDLAKLKGTVPGDKLTNMKGALQEWLVTNGYYVKRSFTYQVVFIFLGVIVLFSGPFVGSMVGLLYGIVGTLSGLVIAVLGYFMPALTLEGVEMRRKVLGFKEFMHTAERYRSQWHEKEHIFANYLPYAIAFDDVDQWAQTFKGLHQEQPDWYSGDMALLTIATSGHFNTVTSSISKATTTPKPNSSGGSGGGGFSGGGFGGGGGGSW